MTRLGAAHYTPRQLAAFFAEPAFRIHEVAETAELWVLEGPEGLVACAGWRPDDDGAALVRSVFVHADWARRGLAGRLLDHIEALAAERGAHAARLVSTLSGRAFYADRGYRVVGPHVYDLDGVRFRGVQMEKPLTTRTFRRSAA